MLYKSLFGLAAACAVNVAVADTVWLKNGDRLSGTIRLFDGGKLLIETEYGGNIAIKWSEVATLESDQELLVKESDLKGERAKSLQASEPGTVILANGEAPVSIALSDIQQIMKPKPVIEDLVWDGNVDLSLDYKQGETDSENYAVDFRTKARHANWRHTADGKYRREFKDDVRTTDNWGAEYALDRFLDEQWFWQGRLNYKRDHVEEIVKQRTIGTGPGYQFWDNELGEFSLASLVGRTDYEFDNGEKEHFYALGLKWDYSRNLWSKSVQLFSDGEVAKPLSGVADYSLDAAVGLRYKVTDWASLNVKAEKDLVSGAEAELDETRYSIGFGIGW